MRLLHSLLPALLLVSSAARADVPTWTMLNSGLESVFGNSGKGVLDPQVQGLTGVAYGNGLWVVTAASTGETTLRWATSPDGLTWTAHTQTLPDGLKTYTTSKVHFLNGKFVFFAEHSSGTASAWCYTSTDGLTWTGNKLADNRHLFEEFDASPTLTVTAGDDADQWISTDLVNWSYHPVVANGTGYSHNDLAYGAGRFVSTINASGQVYTSADGIAWTPIDGMTTPGGFRVEYGNGIFIAGSGSQLWKSTDGIAFAKYTATGPSVLRPPNASIRYAGGRFLCQAGDILLGQSGYIASSDGITWTDFGLIENPPAAPAGQTRGYVFVDLAYGNGKYVLVGTDVTQSLTSKTVLPLIIVADAAADTSGGGSGGPTPPTISTPPQSQSAILGGSVTFTVTANGTGLTYQWKHDGTAIAGATGSSLALSNLQAGDAGNYTVDVTNDGGTTVSDAAVLSVLSASHAGRIVNMSVRANAGTGENIPMIGFVIGGSGTSGTIPMLLRGVGPSLSRFELNSTDLLADPMLTLKDLSGDNLAANDDWGGDATIAATSETLGAFALADTASKDAALLATDLSSRPYSVHVGNGTGIVLAEAYDASTVYTAATPRLVNVSGRAFVGHGDNVLIAGFVIGGETSRNVLIRGVGPGLSGQGVNNSLADPKITLYRRHTVIAENDNWDESTDAQAIGTTATTVGAFALSAGSKDAALVATLTPGVYSAIVSGVNDSSGVALVEVYEAP